MSTQILIITFEHQNGNLIQPNPKKVVNERVYEISKLFEPSAGHWLDF